MITINIKADYADFVWYTDHTAALFVWSGSSMESQTNLCLYFGHNLVLSQVEAAYATLKKDGRRRTNRSWEYYVRAHAGSRIRARMYCNNPIVAVRPKPTTLEITSDNCQFYIQLSKQVAQQLAIHLGSYIEARTRWESQSA